MIVAMKTVGLQLPKVIDRRSRFVKRRTPAGLRGRGRDWVSPTMDKNDRLDRAFASDRNAGSTPPESGEQSSNVVGRPSDAADHAVGFHEQSESAAEERAAFTGEEALRDGGSFDGLGLPVADDTDTPPGQRAE